MLLLAATGVATDLITLSTTFVSVVISMEEVSSSADFSLVEDFSAVGVF